jgi:hypothetical protein
MKLKAEIPVLAMLLRFLGKPACFYLIIVLAISALMIGLYGQIQYALPVFSDWDLHAYRAIDLPPFSVLIIMRVPGWFLAFVLLSGAARGGEPPRRL